MGRMGEDRMIRCVRLVLSAVDSDIGYVSSNERKNDAPAFSIVSYVRVLRCGCPFAAAPQLHPLTLTGNS